MTFYNDNLCAQHVACLTQNMTLRGQLEAGIRFIDLKIRQYYADLSIFKIYRGSTDLNVNLRYVLNVLNQFLSEYGTEVIILSWSNITPPEHQAPRYLKELWEEFDHLIYGIYGGATKYSTPTLDEVRGKVVLINYDKIPTPAYGNFGFYNFNEETNFNVDGPARQLIPQICNPECVCYTDIYLDNLKGNIVRAGGPMTRDQFYMTWVNYKDPNDVCREEMNDRFHSMLQRRFTENRAYGTGIVIMDFPTRAHINNIVSYNLRGTITNFIYLYYNCLFFI